MNNQQKAYMLVFICPEKDKTYNIEVQLDTTFGELGDELHSILQCQPDEKCVLWLQNIELSNDKTLNDYQIGKGRQIEIKIVKTQPQGQQVLGNQKHHYTFLIQEKNLQFSPSPINPNDKGQVAYDLVQEKLESNLWEITIYFGSVLLKKVVSFKDQKVQDGTSFTVNIKHIGGQKKYIK